MLTTLYELYNNCNINQFEGSNPKKFQSWSINPTLTQSISIACFLTL